MRSSEGKRTYKTIKPYCSSLQQLACQLYDINEDDEIPTKNDHKAIPIDCAKAIFENIGILANYLEAVLFKYANHGVQDADKIRTLNGAVIAKSKVPDITKITMSQKNKDDIFSAHLNLVTLSKNIRKVIVIRDKSKVVCLNDKLVSIGSDLFTISDKLFLAFKG